MTFPFELDGIDPVHRQGWSVLVQGTLDHLDPLNVAVLDDRIDPDSWADGKTAWLILRPTMVSGRRLHPTEPDWCFNVEAYL
jgi:hypothetical protein